MNRTLESGHQWSDSHIRIPVRQALLRRVRSKGSRASITSQWTLDSTLASRARGWGGSECQIRSTGVMPWWRSVRPRQDAKPSALPGREPAGRSNTRAASSRKPSISSDGRWRRCCAGTNGYGERLPEPLLRSAGRKGLLGNGTLGAAALGQPLREATWRSPVIAASRCGASR
jgi:hypothetical protein